MSSEKEYLIYCDESDSEGRYFSNFYGGVIVSGSKVAAINRRLNDKKKELNLLGEVKWSKASAPYLEKYQQFIREFFDVVRSGDIRVRIMFRQNANTVSRLTREQIEGAYFRIYYQFVKHAFGLHHRPEPHTPARLRLLFDEFPETKEAVTQFKGFILGLRDDPKIKRAGFELAFHDIGEIRSHDHVIAQGLDVVLGAMSFRLNDKHKEKPEGSRTRGKRTIAKEKLYKFILTEIRSMKPNFNIGISTGTPNGLEDRWAMPYRHWNFVSTGSKFDSNKCKPRTKKPR